MASKDQIIGCIIGGAIGDFIGSPVEGRNPPFEVFVPEKSSISDDTQLTLATCEAIIKSKKPKPEAIAKSFAEWYSARRITGIGSSTLKALRDLSFGAHWGISGASGEMSAGNGAAMRIAPLSFCIDPLSSQGRLLIRDISSITHRNDEAIAGALAVAIAISNPTYDFLPLIIENIWDSNTRDRIIEFSSSDEDLVSLSDKYGSSGYVADTVPLALLGAQRSKGRGFKESLFQVISCGGDTDTIGSITGQIIGSKIGYSNIPDELKSVSFGKENVLQIATDFAVKFAK
jgi:ADP-ribosylglycohydrolase